LRKILQLQLAIKPQLNTLLFRYIGDNVLTDSELDIVNEKICQKILMDGIANIGKTRLDSRIYLKFTLLNPNTKIDDLRKTLNEPIPLLFNLLINLTFLSNHPAEMVKS
jgi:L-2,4-diaminobutyrate decarboxylase